MLVRCFVIAMLMLGMLVLTGCEQASTSTMSKEQRAPSEDPRLKNERELLSKAEAGDVSAQLELGYGYWDGRFGVASKDKSFVWFEKAMNAGNAEATTAIAFGTSTGTFTAPKEADWEPIMRLAAERGDPLAIVVMDNDRDDVVKKGRAAVEEHLRKYHLVDYLPALERVASSAKSALSKEVIDAELRPGKVKRSKEQLRLKAQLVVDLATRAVNAPAVGASQFRFWNTKLFEFSGYQASTPSIRDRCWPHIQKAIDPWEAQRANAMYLLGGLGRHIYVALEVEFPGGTSADVWMRRAAEAGNRDALVAVGEGLRDGAGGIQDYAGAARAFERAANLCDETALRELGRAYLRGHGVPQDLVKAYAFLNLASAGSQWKDFNYSMKGEWLANSGYPQPIRDSVGKRLKPDQLAEAQRLSAEWKPDVAIALGKKTGDAGKTTIVEGALAEQTKGFVGTGFFVSREGHVVTSDHVVGKCADIRIAGKDVGLAIVSRNPRNDIALLKASAPPEMVAVFRKGEAVKVGEEVVSFGFPYKDYLSSAGNVAVGVVSALSGLQNDVNYLQISSPVQPGNSGGPLLDRKGHVIGIVAAKLDAAKVAAKTGDVPQNVNFAVRGSAVATFLDATGVKLENAAWFARNKDVSDVAEMARGFTVPLQCGK